MRIAMGIQILLLIGVLDFINAEPFPNYIEEFEMRVVLDGRHALHSPIAEAIVPDPLSAMHYSKGGLKKTTNFRALIELPSHLNYTSIDSETRGSLVGGYATMCRDSKSIKTERAYIRFQGSERYEAANFIPFKPSRASAEDHALGDHGRIFLKYPKGYIFTALLEPTLDTKYPSPLSYSPFLTSTSSLSPPRSIRMKEEPGSSSQNHQLIKRE